MTTGTRIEELRKKFEENPRRYFAPLANELRKTGDLLQAIALCREHLPKQPGHMSGYIVYGQALYESENLDEARGVFEQAIALDPENLIALRHLGDIARRQGDPAAARRWYERVLDADPRNDDIAAQLVALAIAARPMPAAEALTATDAAQRSPDAAFESWRPVSFTPSVQAGAIASVAPTPDAVMRTVDSDDVSVLLKATSAEDHESSGLSPIDQGVLPGRPSSELLPADALVQPEPRHGAENSVVSLEATTADDGLTYPDAGGIGPAPDVHHATGAGAEPGDETESALPQSYLTEPDGQSGWEVTEVLQMGYCEELDGEAAPGNPLTGALSDSTEPSESADADRDQEVDPFAFGDGEDADVAYELDAVELETSFEEGLAAREWPDTSDLLARVVTPRSVTPTSVEVTREAVDAFGVEASDPQTISLPEPEPDLTEEPSGIMANQGLPDRDTGPLEAGSAMAEDNVVPEYSEGLEAEKWPETPAELPWLAQPGLDDEETPWVEAEDLSSTEAVQRLDVFDEPVQEGESLPEPSAFVTETMAELLVTQGFLERAIGVYEELVRRRPYDPILSSRLAELKEAPAEQIEVRNTEQDDIEVTPQGTPDESSSTSAPVAVFTARERFAALASRRVQRRTPRVSAAVTPRGWSQAVHSVSGSTPSVSHYPSNAADIEQVAGDDALASLFGNVATAEDHLAARALAEAFSPSDAAESIAGDTLFDEMSLLTPTPAYGHVRTATPALATPVTGSLDERSAFDRFFPDPAISNRPGEPDIPPSLPLPEAPNASDSNPGTAEDLAQFSAWLKGLDNS